MNCPNCHQPLEGNGKFCPNCGFQLMNPEPTQPADGALETGVTEQPAEPLSAQETTLEPEWQEPPVTTVETHEEPVFEMQDPPVSPVPPKKSKLPLVIVIVSAVVLLTAVGIFLSLTLGGKGQEESKPAETAASQSETVQPATEIPVETVLSDLVQRYEQALNSGDKDAMALLFAPSVRSLKKFEISAFATVRELAERSGEKIVYSFALQDDITSVDDTHAEAHVAITANLPVVGEQTATTRFRFVKEDGEWFIRSLV